MCDRFLGLEVSTPRAALLVVTNAGESRSTLMPRLPGFWMLHCQLSCNLEMSYVVGYHTGRTLLSGDRQCKSDTHCFPELSSLLTSSVRRTVG